MTNHLWQWNSVSCRSGYFHTFPSSATPMTSDVVIITYTAFINPTASTDGMSECTNAFISESDLIAIIGGLKSKDKQQRLIPSINFTCNGSVTKWIVAGKKQSGRNHDFYPVLQIWRSNGVGTYNQVGSTTLILQDDDSQDLGVYEYSPQLPLEFQAGDVLGIFQPEGGKNKLKISSGIGTGPLNYFVDTDRATMPPSDTFTLSEDTDNDLPLVTVEISKFRTSYIVIVNLYIFILFFHFLCTHNSNCCCSSHCCSFTNVDSSSTPSHHLRWDFHHPYCQPNSLHQSPSSPFPNTNSSSP